MLPIFGFVDRRPDGVALVSLQRPKVNALYLELLRQLEIAARELAAEPPGAVVLWGGERTFAAGAEISAFGGPDEARVFGRQFRDAFEALAAVPRATIAA